MEVISPDDVRVSELRDHTSLRPEPIQPLRIIPVVAGQQLNGALVAKNPVLGQEYLGQPSFSQRPQNAIGAHAEAAEFPLDQHVRLPTCQCPSLNQLVGQATIQLPGHSSTVSTHPVDKHTATMRTLCFTGKARQFIWQRLPADGTPVRFTLGCSP